MNITNSLEKSFLSSYTQSLIKSHWPYISQIIPCTTKPWRYLSISFPLYSFYFIFTYNLTSTFSLNKCNTCYSSFTFADFFYLPSFFLSVIHSDLCYSVSLPLLLPALALSLSSVQSVSHVWLFGTPWTAAQQASLSITNSRSLLKLMSIALEMPSNHLIICRPLLLPPSIFPSIRVFSKESVLCIRWPKYEFQLQHQSCHWIFRTDFL